MRTFLPISLGLVLAACSGDGKKPGDQKVDPNDPTYEEGCILVDGAGGYALLADALLVAQEGSTIELCNGRIEELVFIDQSVDIVGAGIGATKWKDPDRDALENDADASIIVQSGTVTISGISFIDPEITAIHVQGKNADLTVMDMEIDNPGAWGLQVEKGVASVDGVTIRGAAWGGISATDGAELTVTSSTFEDNTVFGIGLDTNASAVVRDSVFARTVDTSPGKTLLDLSVDVPPSLVDGFGIVLDDANGGGASLTSENNEFKLNQAGAVLARDGSVTSAGDTSSFGVAAVVLDNAEATLTDLSLANYWQLGVFAYASTLVIDGATITTDRTLSQIWDPQNSGAMGVVVRDTDLELSNATIHGNDGAGLIVEPANAIQKAVVSLDTVEIHDNGRYNLALLEADVEAIDVDVHDNPAMVDACINATGGYVCDFSTFLVDTSMVWTGGSIVDNGTFGLLAIDGSLTLTDVEVARNGRVGLQVEGGALNLSDSSFSGGNLFSVLVGFGASATMDGITFDGNSYDHVETEIIGTDTIDTVWYEGGRDLVVFEASTAVSNSTFANGNYAIWAVDADVSVTDTTFDTYTSGYVWSGLNGVITNDMANSGSLSLERVTMANLGYYPLYTSGGDLTLRQVSISDTVDTDYAQEIFTNGVSTSSTSITFSSPPVYAFGTSVDIDRLTVDTSTNRGLYTYDSDVKLSDSTFRNVNTAGSTTYAAVDLRFANEAPDALLSDVTVENITSGYGIRIDGTPSYPGGLVDLINIDIGDHTNPAPPDIAGAGLYLLDIDNLNVDGVDVTTAGAEGIRLSNVDGEISGDNAAAGFVGAVTGAQTVGVRIENGSDVMLSDIAINNAGTDGIQVNGASILTTANVTVDGAGGSGIYLDGNGLTGHDLNTTTVTNATDYGMECLNTPVFVTCDATVAGTLGDMLDCINCVP